MVLHTNHAAPILCVPKATLSDSSSWRMRFIVTVSANENSIWSSAPTTQRPFFVFQKQRYEWDPSQEQFVKVVAPVSNDVSFYLNAKPPQSRRDVCEPVRTSIPLPQIFTHAPLGVKWVSCAEINLIGP
jgi:hypothetical protein